MAIETFTKDPDAILDYEIRIGAPAWVTASPYRIGMYVHTTTGKYYKALCDHTSAATFAEDSALWELVDLLWLDDSAGEQISTVAAVTITPGGDVSPDLNQSTAVSIVDTNHAILLWLQEGTIANGPYEVAVRWTTDAGRTDERTIKIKMKEK